MINRDKFYIDGQWVKPSGTKTIDIHRPADGEVIAKIPEGTPADVDAAVAAARRAFDSWSTTPAPKRAEYLLKIHEGLKARADEIAKTITSEMGMPIKLSQGAGRLNLL